MNTEIGKNLNEIFRETKNYEKQFFYKGLGEHLFDVENRKKNFQCLLSWRLSNNFINNFEVVRVG